MSEYIKRGTIQIIGIELKTTNANGLAFKEIPPIKLPVISMLCTLTLKMKVKITKVSIH